MASVVPACAYVTCVILPFDTKAMRVQACMRACMCVRAKGLPFKHESWGESQNRNLVKCSALGSCRHKLVWDGESRLE